MFCDVGKETTYKMDYKNPMNKNPMSFKFTCSDPTVIVPKQDLIKFQPGEIKEVCFILPI